MPDNELATSAFKPTGESLLTPALGDSARFGYRIVLEGVFRCSHNDTAFDALYKTGPDGAFTQRHDYLQWTPRPPVLESEDLARHRYVFRIPAEWKIDGQSVGVRVDVDRFVNEFLIPPSEVRASLSGEMTLRVLQTPLVPPSPWPLLAWSALPAALLVGGVGVVIKRRMALRGLSYELQTGLGRIEAKYRAACAALNRERGTPLQERLNAVREGAFALVRQIQDLRNAQGLLDRRLLEAEIGMLERQAAKLTEAAKREADATLEQKRKSLALLDELAKAEGVCALRLSKIEATLDTTCLTLRSLKATMPGEPAEAALCRELDAEVSAIREVEREFATSETLQMQGLSFHQ